MKRPLEEDIVERREDDEGILSVRVLKKPRTETPAAYALRTVLFEQDRTWWLFNFNDEFHFNTQLLLDPLSVPDPEKREAIVSLLRDDPTLSVFIAEAISGRGAERVNEWNEEDLTETLVGDWCPCPLDPHMHGLPSGGTLKLSNIINVFYRGSFC